MKFPLPFGGKLTASSADILGAGIADGGGNKACGKIGLEGLHPLFLGALERRAGEVIKKDEIHFGL